MRSIRVLIETSWNVKKGDEKLQGMIKRVLIETSWNVKINEMLFTGFTASVLIETSWNVKCYVYLSKQIRILY